MTQQSKPATPARRVYLVLYDPSWTEEFNRESSSVAGALGNVLVAIHHIGSTAIPGLNAKPVIDMLTVVSDVSVLDERGSRLEALGYEAMGEFGIPDRRYFRKNNSDGERAHQIHAFQSGSLQIARHLAFRDYLRAHSEDARAYNTLKQRLAESYPNDISSYTDGKDSFILDIDRKAASWVSARAKETVHANVSTQ